MPVTRVLPSGYCMGVVKAIEQVKRIRKQNPTEKVYVLGMLVHNRYVVKALSDIDVITLEDPARSQIELIDSIDEGIIVFSAHGISDQIKEHALNRGLKIVDASCPFVLNNRKLIRSYLDRSYSVIYVGRQNHPESEAILSMSPDVHLVTGKESVRGLKILSDRIFVTNQTTMSVNDIRDIMDCLRQHFPDAEFAAEVCDATRMRQQAVMDLKDSDVLIVVGDPQSNNTASLERIARESGISAVHKVQSAADLLDLDIDTDKNISVTAGASTPKCLTDSVINYLETKDPKYLLIENSKILNQ